MASHHSPLRRSPTQSRATATLRAIREAALRILKEEGHARLTTNRIAEVAGISIGSLYQYYADKHA
ncbi:MAG TPA: helix-turn-helix domain-containing protein, partial [Rhodocyclaceae bacterium]|nr:helix-turn-helix domain-containing protein [Rhodocyclaceae bacterium]